MVELRYRRGRTGRTEGTGLRCGDIHGDLNLRLQAGDRWTLPGPANGQGCRAARLAWAVGDRAGDLGDQYRSGRTRTDPHLWLNASDRYA